MKTFTTAQAIAKATTEAAKHLAKGEDIRKVYLTEGTGQGGRWIELKIFFEIDSAENGAYIRDLIIEVWKPKNPQLKQTIRAEIF